MSAPVTTGDLISAADWNALIGGGTSDYVATSESTSSGTYVNLTTTGPSITALATGTQALVGVSCRVTSGTTGVRPSMGFQVSSATTLAANENMALQAEISAANDFYSLTYVALVPLNAGSNTFIAKYASLGAGGSATFDFRRIWVIA